MRLPFRWSAEGVVLLLVLTLHCLRSCGATLLSQRATLQQARCVAACLEQLSVTVDQDVDDLCRATQSCSSCTTFCLSSATRHRLTDQMTCWDECGSRTGPCAAACSLFTSTDTPRDALQEAPRTKWNTTGQRVSVQWQSPFEASSDVYLVCISSLVPCDISVSSLVFYLAIGRLSGEVPGASVSTGSMVHVAQVSSRGTSGFSPPSVLLPGAVSDIGVSSTFYSALQKRTYVNISWTLPENDGFEGKRRYQVIVEHEDTSIPRGMDSCTRRIERSADAPFLIVEMLGGGLEFECDYDFTIIPMLATGEAINSSTAVLANRFIPGNVQPPPDNKLDVCEYYNLRRDMNITLSAGAAGSRGLSVVWGWWSFNQTLPVYDFVSSLGPFSVGLWDLSYSQGSPRLLVPSIDPILVDADNSITTVIDIAVSGSTQYAAYITFHLFTSSAVPQTGDYHGICTSPTVFFKLQDAGEGSMAPGSPRQHPVTTPSGARTTPSPGSVPGGAAGDRSTSALTSIVVPAAASLAVILLVAVVVCVQCSRQKKRMSSEQMSPVSGDTMASMAVSDITASTDIGNSRDSLALDGTSDIVRPLPDVWEVARENVHLLEQLGRGAFGQVVRAQLDDPPRLGVQRCEVAVKKLFDTANSYDKTDLLEEISRMKDIASAGGHRHLVRFIGCCTQDDPIYLMTECIAHGSLKDLMQRTRQAIPTDPHLNSMEAQGRPRIALADGHIHSAEACDFARQIAEGMAFLTHMRMIHRDLAARNILVDRGKVLKVSDFGMTRDVYEDPDEVYIKTTGGKVPIRWMSIEALTLRTYSSESDMWSFGVVLWEIATLAKFPYSGVQNRELISELRGGRRMEKPRSCPEELYEIMLQCWSEDPERRPRFSDLVTVFEGLPQKLEQKKQQQKLKGRPSLKSLRPYSFPRLTANLTSKTGRAQPPQAPAAAAPALPNTTSYPVASPLRLDTSNYRTSGIDAI